MAKTSVLRYAKTHAFVRALSFQTEHTNREGAKIISLWGDRDKKARE